MPRLPGQIDAAKTEAILEAAGEVFTARGLSASIDEVARKAKVSKQTIYNRYASKSDLIRAMIAFMDSSADFIGPVNIGNPGEFTMLQLAEIVLNLVGGRSTIQFMPLPQDDPRQRQPDIRLATKELGWAPMVSLEDGLEETIRYFRSIVSS